MSDVNTLTDHFAIEGVVKFDQGAGGLTRIVVTNPFGEAHVYLHGAHVTHFQPKGHQPVLMLSTRSAFAPGKSIRGGIPICFPWFAKHASNPDAPMHGTVRMETWDLDSVSQESDGSVTIVLSRQADEKGRAFFKGEFEVTCTIRVSKSLDMDLTTKNVGAEPFTFEEALHTYFAVGDITKCSITGLSGVEFLDKTDNFARKRQDVEPLVLSGYTDRVYPNTTSTCVIDDAMQGRSIHVEKRNSNTTVVWNPWGNFAPPDLDEWKRMLCVETANCGVNAVPLKPGEEHTMHLKIRCS